MDGSVDPVRDKEIIDFELQLEGSGNTGFQDRQDQRAAGTGDKEAKKLMEVMSACNRISNRGRVPEARSWMMTRKKTLDSLYLLTTKPVIYVCNVERNVLEGNMA